MNMFDLRENLGHCLAVVDIDMDTKAVNKKNTDTSTKTAPGMTYNLKKTSIVKASWRRQDVESQLQAPIAKAAYRWLYEHNATYRRYVDMHRRKLKEAADNPEFTWWIPTATLLFLPEGR